MTCWNFEKNYIEFIAFCHIECWAVLEASKILKSIMLNIAYRIQGVPNTSYLECASTQIVFSTKKSINVWQKTTNGNKNHVLLVFRKKKIFRKKINQIFFFGFAFAQSQHVCTSAEQLLGTFTMRQDRFTNFFHRFWPKKCWNFMQTVHKNCTTTKWQSQKSRIFWEKWTCVQAVVIQW